MPDSTTGFTPKRTFSARMCSVGGLTNYLGTVADPTLEKKSSVILLLQAQWFRRPELFFSSRGLVTNVHLEKTRPCMDAYVICPARFLVGRQTFC